MKNIFWISLALVFLFSSTHAQTNINIGGGYFGHTITHPGVVVEFELEKMYSEKVAIPIRIDLGFYSHPRNHDGIFLDGNFGFRQYYQSGLFLEESIGVGAMATFLNADGVFEVNENGNASEIGKFSTIDFIPSITLGIGYNLTKKKEVHNLIWVRPKIFWQIPHKTSSTFNPILQIGFTHQLK